MNALLFVTIAIGISHIHMIPTTPIKEECQQVVDHCEPLEIKLCLGAVLPYSHTSLVFANDSRNQKEVEDNLTLWSFLRYAPRCWEVVKHLLCAVYLPKCTTNNVSVVEVPDYWACERTRQPCKIVADREGWPEFLQCHKPHFFPDCVNAIQSLESNITAGCNAPLIRTENEKSWFKDVEGCGIQCENPLFTPEEHNEVHRLIAILGTLCMACTAFTILTFIVDWKVANRYPALILFFINVCFFTGSLGWMAQFIPGMREEIVCKIDGTVRRSEPQSGSGESAWCSVIFFIVYFSMIAAFMWFVILAYAWNITFRAFGNARETLEQQRAFFHLASWSVPLVLTTVCLTIAQVDGDSLSGICFVGYFQYAYRVGFVLIPVALVLIAGVGFIGAGLVTLAKLQCTRPGLISDRASAKIKETIVRLGVFAGLAFVFIFTTFIVHVYTFVNEAKWAESFEKYIVCKAQLEGEKQVNKTTSTCVQENKPNLYAMEVHVCAFFGAGIVMSSWVWNMSTIRAWKRAIRRLLRKEKEQVGPLKVKKHRVIAQAFHKRKQMNAGRLSLSFASNRDDPLGLQFDLNSISSQEMTSVWTAALPRMVSRRGAMVYPSMPMRRHSDSDLDSMKSLSSLNKRVVQIQAEILRRQSSHSRHSQESQSQQESQESDRSRRGKRRHRKKRTRNRVGPFGTHTSTPSVPSAPGTSSLADEARKGSLTSLGTNPSLTNISNTPQQNSNNTSQVPSSDEGRVTPEPGRPQLDQSSPEFKRRQPGTKLPTARSKAMSELVTATSTAVDQFVNHSAVDECVHSSDEDIITPKMKRPTLPALKQSKEEEEAEESIRSSDENCWTPVLQRPSTACTRVMNDSSEDSINSSDSGCATPELKRPDYIQALHFTTVTKETKTTVFTGTVGPITRSLLDQVDLEDLDDLDSESDFSEPQIRKSRSREPTKPQKAQQQITLRNAKNNPVDKKTTLDRYDRDKTRHKSPVKPNIWLENGVQLPDNYKDMGLALCEKDKKQSKSKRKRHNRIVGNDDVIPTKIKRHRNKQRHDSHNNQENEKYNFHSNQLLQALTPQPFDCDSEGRSRSPQMSPFQKVKDWIFAPQLSPVEALTPVKDLGVDLEMSLMHKSNKSESPSKRRRGKVNQAFEESEA